MLLLASLNLKAQEKSYFALAVHGGIPVSNLGEAYSSNFGIDSHFFKKIRQNKSGKIKIYMGISASYSYYSGDEIMEDDETISVHDAHFLPVTLGHRMVFSDRFIIGGNGGYAFGLDNNSDGGLYTSSRLSYQIKNVQPYVAYRNIFQDGSALGSIQFGFVYLIK